MTPVWQSARRCLLSCLLLLVAVPTGAESAAVIERQVSDAVQDLRGRVPGSVALLQDAAGVLVFPRLVKMGIGPGEQYGEGALLIDDRVVAYYANAGPVFGLPLAQGHKTEVLVFKTPEALAQFRRAAAWQVGKDAAVTVVEMTDEGQFSTERLQAPIIGFILSAEGAVNGLGMEGNRITRLAR